MSYKTIKQKGEQEEEIEKKDVITRMLGKKSEDSCIS